MKLTLSLLLVLVACSFGFSQTLNNLEDNGVNVQNSSSGTGYFQWINLKLAGNTISSTDTNGNIVLAPNGSGIVSISSNLSVDPDTDASTTLGRVRIDSRFTDYAYLSHYDQSDALSYMIAQDPTGGTFLNAKTGKAIRFRINNADEWYITSTGDLFGYPGNNLTVGNIKLDANTISSTDLNGNIILDPNGSGQVNFSSSQLTNVADPVNAQDAATKAYVDANSGTTFPLTAPNGSLSAPSYSFVNETTSGMYHNGSNALFFSESGSNKLELGFDVILHDNIRGAADGTYNLGAGTYNFNSLYISGSIQNGNGSTISVAEDFVPSSSNNFDLGTEFRQWVDLYIDGTAEIDLLTINNSYTFPSADGTNGQVLATDGAGTLSFQDVPTGISNLEDNGTDVQNSTTGTGALKWDNVSIDGNTISSTDLNGNIILDPNGSGQISFSSSQLTNVADPVNAQDAATKAYVDANSGTSFPLLAPDGSAGSPSYSFTDNDTGIYGLGGDFIGFSTGGSSRFSINNSLSIFNNELRVNSGNDVQFGGSLFIQEEPAAGTNRTGFGQLWVRNDVPNTLMFTDDEGNDHDLTVGGGEDYIVINSAGTLPTASGADAISIGESAEGQNTNAISIGTGAGSTTGLVGTSSISIGDGANSATSWIGTNSIGIGRSVISRGTNSGALGNVSQATGVNAWAIGAGATATATNAIALGESADATAQGALVFGRRMRATAQGAIIMGWNTSDVTNSISDSFELSWDGTTGFKVGSTYGTGITTNADPDTNLTDAVAGSMAWDSTDGEYRFFDGVSWNSLGGGGNSFPLLATNGSAGTPSYSFSANPGQGMYSAGLADLRFTVAGADQLLLKNNNAIFKRQVLGPRNQTAAAPTYSFESDTNLGMYQVTWDVLGFVTNGVLRQKINADGHIEPGTNESYDLGIATASFREAFVNDVTMGSSSTISNERTITAAGSSPHIDLKLIPKGVGTIKTPTGYDTRVVSDEDLINKKYFDDNTSSLLTNVSDPTNPQDVATKAYVDANSSGSQWTTAASDINFTGGNVAIGTTTIPSGYKLAVDGKIIAEEVLVELSTAWPDYVFESDYRLLTLEEIEKFIKSNKHLPEMPSAKEMEEKGIELGTMNSLLLKKIEELMLHTIEQEKKIDELSNEPKATSDKLSALEMENEALKKDLEANNLKLEAYDSQLAAYNLQLAALLSRLEKLENKQ